MRFWKRSTSRIRQRVATGQVALTRTRHVETSPAPLLTVAAACDSRGAARRSRPCCRVVFRLQGGACALCASPWRGRHSLLRAPGVGGMRASGAGDTPYCAHMARAALPIARPPLTRATRASLVPAVLPIARPIARADHARRGVLTCISLIRGFSEPRRPLSPLLVDINKQNKKSCSLVESEQPGISRNRDIYVIS